MGERKQIHAPSKTNVKTRVLVLQYGKLRIGRSHRVTVGSVQTDVALAFDGEELHGTTNARKFRARCYAEVGDIVRAVHIVGDLGLQLHVGTHLHLRR